MSSGDTKNMEFDTGSAISITKVSGNILKHTTSGHNCYLFP